VVRHSRPSTLGRAGLAPATPAQRRQPLPDPVGARRARKTPQIFFIAQPCRSAFAAALVDHAAEFQRARCIIGVALAKDAVERVAGGFILARRHRLFGHGLEAAQLVAVQRRDGAVRRLLDRTAALKGDVAQRQHQALRVMSQGDFRSG
jgi:hypothetical protein